MCPQLFIAQAQDAGWHFGLHDPSFEGWAILIAYALAAAITLQAAAGSTGRDAFFWWIVAGLMAFLCLNKQLDLQSLVTDWGRSLAKEQGWLDRRRSLQAGFVLGIGILMFIVAAGMLWFMRRSLWRLRLAILGLTFVAGFVLARAASFHHLDSWLGTPIDPGNYFRYNALFELPGIVLIAIAARLHVRATNKPKSSPNPRHRSTHAD
ncbi:isopropylmalate isomerase [Mucisphaera sp.]|uniref:isopropylmalate isomerase n=1 Tax=Mucisphaera sp. TaxID=2913024 RepID=UPI003D0FC5D7